MEGSFLGGKGYRGGTAAGAMVQGSGPPMHRHPPPHQGAGGCFSGISMQQNEQLLTLPLQQAGWWQLVAACPVGVQGIMELLP